MINILEDNYRRRMEESEHARDRKLEKLIGYAWDRKHKKVVEKYEEDYQTLKEQNKDLASKLSAANASAQLYRSVASFMTMSSLSSFLVFNALLSCITNSNLSSISLFSSILKF